MKGKTLTALVVIGTVAYFLGWYDLFHLMVGIPLLILGAFLFKWGKKQMQLEEEEEESEEEANLGRQVFIGALGSLAMLLLLAGGFWVASAVGVSKWLDDCPYLLNEISILEEGKAHARIVQVIEERLQRKISSACRGKLMEKKILAVLGWAEEVTGEEKTEKLDIARKIAVRLDNPTLLELTNAKYDVARADGKIAQLEETIRQQDETLIHKEEMIWRLKNGKIEVRNDGPEVVINLPDIFFEPGRANLTVGARATLKEVADKLNCGYKGQKLQIAGYTDSTGDPQYNKRLSEERARTVATVLVESGVNAQRIEKIAGHGEDRPIAKNDTAQGRAKNRRVEIIIQK
jgi:outer membrane protein OmpA-like peptidoglycan-associated protein